VQTLKTAIVVLLLMTVMYGSYVSLTTPPEPLPDAVASLIQESDSFDLQIDEGLPESLSELAVDTGQPSTNSDSAITANQDMPAFTTQAEDTTLGVPTNPKSSSGITAPGFADTTKGVTGTLSDAAMTLSASDGGIDEYQLPKPPAGGAVPAIDSSRNYPATGPGSMNLPDPASLAALPDSGWNKNAKPVSFELPRNTEAVTASLQDVAPTAVTASANSLGLANAIRTADRQYAADQHMDALATLSLFYNTPDLSPSDRDALFSRLDPLAASVIYSRRHLLEQPHRVGANETLMEIAARYELPWQLLANINGIQDPVSVLPGTELKVVRGPFRAEVDLQRNELTIFLRDLYAGRFPIVVGSDPKPEAGTYTIQDKQTARTFYDKNGSPVPPGDTRNPYGTVWMDLGKQLCIHGSPDRSQASSQGCISLRGQDAEDLYGILTQGSSVNIRR
jgi:lipoprotein-anchoring transpeptidase ErfK/SrfK